jgi:hypothetical protein
MTNEIPLSSEESKSSMIYTAETTRELEENREMENLKRVEAALFI